MCICVLSVVFCLCFVTLHPPKSGISFDFVWNLSAVLSHSPSLFPLLCHFAFADRSLYHCYLRLCFVQSFPTIDTILFFFRSLSLPFSPFSFPRLQFFCAFGFVFRLCVRFVFLFVWCILLLSICFLCFNLISITWASFVNRTFSPPSKNKTTRNCNSLIF